MKKILLAGATGYLGSFILQELLTRNYSVRIIVRNKSKLPWQIVENNNLEILNAELTNPDAIENSCRDIDTVVSTVGITKQKDGLNYMDVDFQANLNLLKEAERSGVKKFIYVSVFNGEKLTRLRICQAKEMFVSALKQSSLNHCIIRPTGYFSDMSDFYKMAKKGSVYVFGDGNYKMNPIHGIDLAKACVNAIQTDQQEIPIGGPTVFTYNEIAKIVLSIAGKKTHIRHIPKWITNSVLFLLRTFTNSKTYGPIEFFMTVLSMDMIAPLYGEHSLEEYFKEL